MKLMDKSRRNLLAVALVTLLLMIMVATATADGVYHSQHVEFHSVDGSPLRSGFIQNIHPNGPQLYAIERYVLNGASPNTDYYVNPLVYLDSADCSTIPVPFAVDAVISTNGAGNGSAQATLNPEAVAGLGGLTVSVTWQLLAGAPDGPVAYESDCGANITLD